MNIVVAVGGGFVDDLPLLYKLNVLLLIIGKLEKIGKLNILYTFTQQTHRTLTPNIILYTHES